MKASRILGVALLVAGVLALVYGRFSYTKETHEAKLGPLEFSVEERETIAIPEWAGIVAIAAGGLTLLAAGWKK